MFDLKRLKFNKLKKSNTTESYKLHSFIIEDIIDRLEPLDRLYNNILVIDDNLKFYEPKVQSEFHLSNINRIQSSEIERTAEIYDLIIFPFGMHWVAEVQLLLANAKRLIAPNGIFICNFPGGGSLQKLRRLLLELEINNACPNSPHLSPLIQFEHVTPLLQQAGFAENIIDMESLKLEYNSPLDLMHAIQNTGEKNVLIGTGGYSISKKVYKSLISYPNDRFIDHLNLITFLSSPSKNSVKLKAEYFNPGPRS